MIIREGKPLTDEQARAAGFDVPKVRTREDRRKLGKAIKQNVIAIEQYRSARLTEEAENHNSGIERADEQGENDE